MIDLKFKRIINKPVEEVWKCVFDDFAKAHLWAMGTPTCRKGQPDENFDRVCDTETGRLKDTITKVDRDNYMFEFTVEGLPFFVRSVVSTWKLRELSIKQNEINLGTRIEVKPGIGTIAQIPMRLAFKRLYPGLLDDLTTYIETGRPSSRKQEEINRLRQ